MVPIPQISNVALPSARTTTWLDGNIDCIIKVRKIFISPVIYWVAPVSKFIIFTVVGDCKYLEIPTVIILEDINVDAELLMVGVEVDVFGIDCVWLLVDWNISIHLHMGVWKYLLHFVLKVCLSCVSNRRFEN